MTSTKFNILDYLIEEGKNKLHSFSELANKSTGSNHPNDRERWFDFIIQTYHDGTDASGVLERIW